MAGRAAVLASSVALLLGVGAAQSGTPGGRALVRRELRPAGDPIDFIALFQTSEETAEDEGISQRPIGGSNVARSEALSKNASTNGKKVIVTKIPAAYRKYVKSPSLTGPGTMDTKLQTSRAKAAGVSTFQLFFGGQYSDCARSLRLRTFTSWKVMDLSDPACKNGTIANEGEGTGRFAGSMKFCQPAEGDPEVTMYNKPRCPEGQEWHRSLAITRPQLQGILARYCIQTWASANINAHLVNYQLSTGKLATCPELES